MTHCLRHARALLPLLAAALCLVFPGCQEKRQDPKAKAERLEKIASKTGAASDLPLPEIPSLLGGKAKPSASTTVWLFAADQRRTFSRVQAARLRLAVESIPGLVLEVADAAGDALAQTMQLEKAARGHPRYVIVEPVIASLAEKFIPDLRRQGAFVIGIGEQWPEGSCDAVIYCDPFKLGFASGQEVVSALRRKATDEGRSQVTGRVVQLTWDDRQSHASKRCAEGFAEALKAEPGIILVHDAPAYGNREQAAARTHEALRTQLSFDVVVAQDDIMALGASDALLAAKKREEVLIVGMDALAGSGGGLEMLWNAQIDASVWQPMPLEKAFGFIRERHAQANFQPPARTERIPEVVTPANLEAFSQALTSGAKM